MKYKCLDAACALEFELDETYLRTLARCPECDGAASPWLLPAKQEAKP